jgi:hypothetical protein
MPKLFTLEDQVHHADDPECPACSEGYPERCQCGGLMHATGVATEENSDVVPITRCDQCGRSKEDLEEVA